MHPSIFKAILVIRVESVTLTYSTYSEVARVVIEDTTQNWLNTILRPPSSSAVSPVEYEPDRIHHGQHESNSPVKYRCR